MKFEEKNIGKLDSLFSDLPLITDNDSLMDEINNKLDLQKKKFKSGKKYTYVSDLKNSRKALGSIIGDDVIKKQYPNYSNSDSAKYLMWLITPLNILSPKWRKQYILKESQKHYSLGCYDFIDDKYHDGAIAVEIFEKFIQDHGNYYHETLTKCNRIERNIIEIIRLKPRVDNNYQDDSITYLCGLSEAYIFLDNIIDNYLDKYDELPHPVSDEIKTRSFYQHFCKNAGLNYLINSGNYHIKESEDLEKIILEYLNWNSKDRSSIEIPNISNDEYLIAKCIAAMHACDRAPKKDISLQLHQNLNPKYLKRVTKFVHYLRFGKNNDKNIMLRLIRRGNNNKYIQIYPTLVEFYEKVYSEDNERLIRNILELLEKKEIYAEITKYLSNIFSAMSCWEEEESNADIHMTDYCSYRKSVWSYRTKFMYKLLRLDYYQLEQFYREVNPILFKEYRKLDSILEEKNKVRIKNEEIENKTVWMTESNYPAIIVNVYGLLIEGLVVSPSGIVMCKWDNDGNNHIGKPSLYNLKYAPNKIIHKYAVIKNDSLIASTSDYESAYDIGYLNGFDLIAKYSDLCDYLQ